MYVVLTPVFSRNNYRWFLSYISLHIQVQTDPSVKISYCIKNLFHANAKTVPFLSGSTCRIILVHVVEKLLPHPLAGLNVPKEVCNET